MTRTSSNRPPPAGIRIGRWQFTPGWIPSIATALMLCLLFNLGLWQLQRAHAKEAILERLATRSQLATTDLHSLLELNEDVTDYPVRLEGEYLNDFNFLLDNRVQGGRPGYEVLTAFLTQGQIVLVNRGWIEQGATRAQFPDIPASTGVLTLEGLAQVPNPAIFVLKEDDYTRVQWPFLVQKIDLEKTAALFDHPTAPFVLRLNPDSSSGFVREWHSNFMGPEKHYGYAVQWFSLFAALCIIYLVVNTHRRP
jgi:surfeit locus 1 family protein